MCIGVYTFWAVLSSSTKPIYAILQLSRNSFLDFWKYRWRNVHKMRRGFIRPTPTKCPAYVSGHKSKKSRILFRIFWTKLFHPRADFLSCFLVCFFCRSRLCWRISGLRALGWIFMTDRSIVGRHHIRFFGSILTFCGFCLATVCATLVFHLSTHCAS